MTQARTHLRAITVLAFSSLILLARCTALKADETGVDLVGMWKLVVMAFGDDEFAVIRFDRNDGKERAFVVNTQASVLGIADNLNVESLVNDRGTVSFTLKGPSSASKFLGKLAAEGPSAGQILGTFQIRNETFPARLEKTREPRLADRRPSALIRSFAALARNPDPVAKVNGLRQGLRRYRGTPTNYLFYVEILGGAAAAELQIDEVRTLVDEMIKEAEPYGDAWVQEVRLRALKVMGTAKPYAEISLGLASDADRSMDKDSKLEHRAIAVAMLARAASLAGKPEIARLAEARSREIESQLDEEYDRTVPPFKPVPFKGRNDAKADGVVLMELFSGVQCMPCVAVDVAFDALLKTYKPTEFIGLQYHLHIPGFDALTNKDTEARRDYYGEEIHGTPAVSLNGRFVPPSGGQMNEAEARYNEFRGLIDRQLEASRGANIALSARRDGDELEISAEATLVPGPGQTEDAKSKARPRLRLVLTERSVRYIGANKLRIHHHVVRDFPGGLEGKDLSAGEGRLHVKLSLPDLKRSIEEYLSDVLRSAPIQPPIPPIGLEDLSVVAFVQDDTTRSILHAVTAPVERAKP